MQTNCLPCWHNADQLLTLLTQMKTSSLPCWQCRPTAYPADTMQTNYLPWGHKRTQMQTNCLPCWHKRTHMQTNCLPCWHNADQFFTLLTQKDPNADRLPCWHKRTLMHTNCLPCWHLRTWMQTDSLPCWHISNLGVGQGVQPVAVVVGSSPRWDERQSKVVQQLGIWKTARVWPHSVFLAHKPKF